MTSKLLVGVFLILLTCGLTFFCLNLFTERVEEFILLVDEVLVSGEISSSIGAYYEMEEFFEENETLFFVMVHDDSVADIRECMAEIRGCFFGKDHDGAVLALSILRQKLESLIDSSLPSVGNVI